MSKEEIIDSLYDILDEINETHDDDFVDIVYIKETLENIINLSKNGYDDIQRTNEINNRKPKQR